jgi:hypothetical protein
MSLDRAEQYVRDEGHKERLIASKCFSAGIVLLLHYDFS